MYIYEKNGKRRKAESKKCKFCNNVFLDRINGIRKYCSLNCKHEDMKKRVKVKCTYCDKEFFKILSKLKNSKSGLYFCSRSCKDKAQTISFGCQQIMPRHYNKINSNNTYRKHAFRLLKHECAICEYNEYERILEVHHIDEDRNNSNISNLIILCPNCHAKITLKLYTLEELLKKGN